MQLSRLLPRIGSRGNALRLPVLSTGVRGFASAAKVKTGIVMMNMGGPEDPAETGPFLKRLFNDQDIIDLGGGQAQKLLGDFVSWRRAPGVAEQYEEIGGSPITKWTRFQGVEMCKILDKTRPESAPHKAYIAFRYTHPLTEQCLAEMEADGVEHAIAFSQYPHWSCTTSGSSMNELWRELKRLNKLDTFQWSIIDRWHKHEGWMDAVIDRMVESLSEFDDKTKNKFTFVFSAHSVPMKVVEKGDHYVGEVAASVDRIMDKYAEKVAKGEIPGVTETNKYILSWQSKVGYMPWMVPNTGSALTSLGKKGVKSILAIPIAFTSDHIETLFELGIEYKHEAEEAGVKNFIYTTGMNGSELFIQAQADIVKQHLEEKRNYSTQYKTKCLECTKPLCRQINNPRF